MEKPHRGEGFEKGRGFPQQALSIVLDHLVPKVHVYTSCIQQLGSFFPSKFTYCKKKSTSSLLHV